MVRSSYAHHHKAGAYFRSFKILQWCEFPVYNIYSSLKDGNDDNLLLGYSILNQVLWELLCRLKKPKHFQMCLYYGQGNWIRGVKRKPSITPASFREACINLKSEARFSVVFCSGQILSPMLVLVAGLQENHLCLLQTFYRPACKAGTLQQVLCFCSCQSLRKNWANTIENITSATVFKSIWINNQTKLNLQSLSSLPIVIFSGVPHYLEIKGNAG